MYTKYEVSMFKPVVRRGVTDNDANTNNDDVDTNDDGQKHDCVRLFG